MKRFHIQPNMMVALSPFLNKSQQIPIHPRAIIMPLSSLCASPSHLFRFPVIPTLRCSHDCLFLSRCSTAQWLFVFRPYLYCLVVLSLIWRAFLFFRHRFVSFARLFYDQLIPRRRRAPFYDYEQYYYYISSIFVSRYPFHCDTHSDVVISPSMRQSVYIEHRTYFVPTNFLCHKSYFLLFLSNSVIHIEKVHKRPRRPT